MAKIMAVDDEVQILNVVEKILEKGGYEVVIAGGGKECLEKLKDEKPDLILLDIMMPEMDGWETLERIKENPEFASTPVAMLTALELTPETMRQNEIKYLIDYIQKPFTAQRLVSKTREILKINNEIGRVRDRLDQSTLREYEYSLKVRTLHENLVETLKSNSLRKLDVGLQDEAEDITRAITEEERIIEVLREREESILGP